ncbi:hypothetical protein EMCRGX_G026647 [Ephydatia muelleri]
MEFGRVVSIRVKFCSKNYEVFTPVITYGDQKQTNLDVSIVTKTYNFIIRLTKNEVFPTAFTMVRWSDIHPGRLRLVLAAELEGHLETWLKGRTHFTTSNHLVKTRKCVVFWVSHTYCFRTMESQACRSENSRKNTLIPNKVDQELYNWRQRVGSQSAPLIIRLVIINDLAMYKKYGKDLEKTLNRAIDIVNAVDSMYKILGIRIVLVEAITWSDGDRITVVESDMEKTYRNFKEYVKTASTAEKDAILLLSGIVFTDDNNGMGRLNSVCDPFSLAVVRDRDILYQTSSTTAHELGHTLGLDHDNDITNERHYPALKVMFLKPLMLMAICGNGILEGSEKCDCGSVVECTDPCCDARKCQLKSGANYTNKDGLPAAVITTNQESEFEGQLNEDMPDEDSDHTAPSYNCISSSAARFNNAKSETTIMLYSSRLNLVLVRANARALLSQAGAYGNSSEPI